MRVTQPQRSETAISRGRHALTAKFTSPAEEVEPAVEEAPVEVLNVLDEKTTVVLYTGAVDCKRRLLLARWPSAVTDTCTYRFMPHSMSFGSCICPFLKT